MTASVLPLLIQLSDITFACFFKILLCSTIVIVCGLVTEFIFRHRGAVFRSFILKMTLCATLIVSAASLFCFDGCLMVFNVQSPSGYIEKLLAGRPTNPRNVNTDTKASLNNHNSNSVPAISPRVTISEKQSHDTHLAQNKSAIPTIQENIFHFDIGYNNLLYGFIYIAVPSLWLLMSLFFLVRFLMGTLYVLYLRLNSAPAEKHLLTACDEISRILHVKAPPVLRSKIVNRTLLFGIFKPFILLPIWNFTDTMATREVFLHELAHLKRHDNVWNIISQMSKFIVPLQPLLGLLISRITDYSDYVCDDFVVHHISDRKIYANQLIHMAYSISNARFISANGMGIAEKKSQLRKRIERIMSTHHVPVISVRFVHTIPILLLLAVPTAVSGIIDVSRDDGQADDGMICRHDYMVFESHTVPTHPLLQNNDIPAAMMTSNTREENATNDINAEHTVIPIHSNTFQNQSTNKVDTTHHIPAEVEIHESSENTSRQKALRAEEAMPPNDILNVKSDILPEPDTHDFQPEETESSPDNAFIWADNTDEDAETASAPPDTVAVTYEPYIPATTSYIRTSVPDPIDFEPENFAGRKTISVEIPEFRHLPIMDQLFYYDAVDSQESPVWSPDGKTIAFNGRAGMGIWTVPAEGGTATLVHSNYHEYEANGVRRAAYGSLTPLAFSPDGSEIFFHDWSLNAEGHKDLGNGSTANNNPQIKVVNIKSGEVRILIKRAGFGSFTSDCRICVYVKYAGYPSWGGIYARNLETGEEWRVTSEGQEACLSTDETEVIYSVRNNGVTHLKKIPLEGGESEFITNFDTHDICRNPFYSQCTPDGKSVIFIASYNDWLDTSGFYSGNRKVNYHGLCSMNLETGEVTRITPDSQYLIRGIPRISPDGTKIILGGGKFSKYSGILSEMQIYDFKPSGSGKITASESDYPETFSLAGNYPNPFNMATTLTYSLHTDGAASLEIYNSLGQKIDTLVSNELQAGTHSIVWDGCNDNGSPVSSGVYIARLKMKGKVATHRMTLAK